MSEVEKTTQEPTLKVTVGAEEPQQEQKPVEDKHAEEAPSLEQLIRDTVQEEDAPITQSNLSFRKVLLGDFLTTEIVRRQIWLILLITALLIAYISQRYSYQKYMVEIDKLSVALEDAKFKALSSKSELTERTRQSKILDMLKLNNDSLLKIADRPPYYIKVPE